MRDIIPYVQKENSAEMNKERIYPQKCIFIQKGIKRGKKLYDKKGITQKNRQR